jgi:predicted ATP-grasp superfamily ATP-dependent carboligase
MRAYNDHEPKPVAIVTDAVWRKSLAAIRALGRSGFEVYALGDSRFTTGFYSRYTTRSFIGPSAAEDPSGFGAVLRQVILRVDGKPTVLFPMEDATCEWVLKYGSTLPTNIRWLLPDAKAFSIARDKGRTMALAKELGLPCPRTLKPETIDELRYIIDREDLRKFILKPRTGSGSGGIIYGDRIRELDLVNHWSKHGTLLLQERIPADGEARGVSMLFDQSGAVRSAFAHRRLRQYPVTGGPSTQRESVVLDTIYDHSVKLLKALSWKGVAMVEWKIHPQSGQPLLLEVNPRFWGSLALAIRAGVDFPSDYAKLSLGIPFATQIPADYDVGVRSRWLLPGDILRYLHEPVSARETIGDFLSGICSDSEEFDINDLRGSVASVLCPAVLILNPKYFRYLRKAR